MEPFRTTKNPWERLQMQQNAAEHFRQYSRTFSNFSDKLKTQENAWKFSKTFHNTYNPSQCLKMQQHPTKPESDSDLLETFQNRSEQRERLKTSHNIHNYPRLSMNGSELLATFQNNSEITIRSQYIPELHNHTFELSSTV